MNDLRGPFANPGYHLWHAARCWLETLKEPLGALELTHTQFFVLGSLVWLEREARRPNQRELAGHAGVDLMTTSSVLRRLEDKGLLLREPDAEDARALRVTPTAEGRRLGRAAAAAVVKASAEFFAPLGEGQEALREMLMRLTEPPEGEVRQARGGRS